MSGTVMAQGETADTIASCFASERGDLIWSKSDAVEQLLWTSLSLRFLLHWWGPACKLVPWDPKGGELSRVTPKPWETVVEVGRITDVQIVCRNPV